MTTTPTPLSETTSGSAAASEKKDEKEEEKKPLRGLVMAANIVSVLLMIGVIITAFYMVGMIKADRLKDQDAQQQRAMDAIVSDSVAAATNFAGMIDSLNSHTGNTDAATEELSNELKYSELDADLGSTGKDGKLRDAMTLLKKEAQERIDKMDQLKSDLDDEVSKNGSYNRISSTQSFFIAGGRADLLLSELKSFRNNMVSTVSQAGVDDMSSSKEHMPLDDWTSYTGAESWDVYQFQGDPDNAKAYIDNLETEVRLFEGDILRKIEGSRY